MAGLTDTVAVLTSPPGAAISIQDYLAPDSAWVPLGTTPLAHVRVPRGYFRWKVQKAGVGDMVVAPMTRGTMWFPLDSMLQAPAGMVRVGASRWANMIAFVGWVGPFDLPTFYLDRYEVTNREFQTFVDSGGYSNPSYWQAPFTRDGTQLSFDDAMALFRDGSGRPGPSTWTGGHYPDGTANHPVSGVSWFEAMAYARFAHKSLPTFAQWFEAAPDEVAGLVVRVSNINRTAVAPVGTHQGLGPFGSFDMAGNVREWALNALGADRRFVLGGSWRSQLYLAADPEALSAFDRSPENGIRCVRNVSPLGDDVTRAITPLERDFGRYTPVSDGIFEAYRALYSYNKGPVNGKRDGVVEETSDWTREKVTYDAAYGDERITAYLFLPKRVRPPYQTVIFFP
ncbi:MAG: SUMF1/EgtB/PvdO family nonheme iron enzyme, partial [Gemmatimonadaceae bacterium]